MKRYWKEGTIVLLQAALYWLLPLFAGPTDAMGMVVLMLCGTLLLSAVLGAVSRFPVKFAYPAVVTVLFIPSVPVYYNMSAMIHATWYFVLALVGVGFGALIGYLADKIMKKA